LHQPIYLHSDAEKIWENTRKIETEDGSIGTGCLVRWNQNKLAWSELEQNSNVVITNAHVVDGQKEVTVSAFSDGDYISRKANLVAIDYPHDLAVLEVNMLPEDFGHDGLFVGDYPKIGEPVLLCGFPLGVETPRLSGGLISGYAHMPIEGRMVRSLVIQAPVNQGNSGGPVCNAAGELVGIVYAINSRLKTKLKKPSSPVARQAIDYIERALNPVDGFGYVLDPIDVKRMISSHRKIAMMGQYLPSAVREMELPRSDFVSLQRQIASIDDLSENLSCIGPFNINPARTSLHLGFYNGPQWELDVSQKWLDVCRKLKEYHFYLKGYTIVAYYKGGPQYRRGIWTDRISLTLT
jgi:hypothetical protein